LKDNRQRLKALILVVLFADLMAVAAWIRVPLPPVPLTMQTLVALLSGALLGSRAGLLSQVLYLGMGLAGLPVFAGGGGLGYILSPTFGYLAGFCAGSWVTGYILEKRPSRAYGAVFFSMLAGLAVIYAFGLPWLYLNLLWVQGNISPAGVAVKLGLLSPLPGDLLKIALAPPIAVAVNTAIYGFAEVGLRE
jgi:biotin transport system substrate-specific component